MRLPPSPLHCKGGEGGSPVPSAAGFFITGACLLGYLSLRARNGPCKFAQVPFHFSGGILQSCERKFGDWTRRL